MQAWTNQKFITVSDQATVSQISSNFCFFETFALRGGSVESPEFHEARMMSGLNHLNLDKSKLYLNFSDKIHHWSPILKNLLSSEKLTDAIVRWMVIPSNDGSLTEWVTVRQLPATPASADLFLLKTVRDKAEWLPRPKTGPWKNSQAALDELKNLSQNLDVEGVQFDSLGNISDCTRSALAWWDGAEWFTPSQKTQCLSSTSLQTFQNSLSSKQSIKHANQPFPRNAQSLIVLRSTFEGGAVGVKNVFTSERELIWTAPLNQDEARSALTHLKTFRVQRSVSLL
jgi:branched-subunit amino acid aminotransferase/4-amino-4-deoxychorismate lyase